MGLRPRGNVLGRFRAQAYVRQTVASAAGKNQFVADFSLLSPQLTAPLAVVYKLAMFACLAAECAATYSLNKYEKLQVHAEALSSTVHLENNDLINAEITTIVFCVLVACLFGADFFFLVFFPRRTYPTWYNITKRVCAVVITTGVFVSALISTWVVACREAILTGMTAQELAATFPRPPLSE
jgi:hypothetical protein